MRIVLINPPTPFEQIYGEWDLSALDTYTPPLGILHVASYIRKYRHAVRVFDFQIPCQNIEASIQQILAWQPDVVGLTAMTSNCLNALWIAREIKKNIPSLPVVLGGSHISAIPLETMKRFEAVDYGVIGEGEVTLLELLENVADRRPVETVKGVVWRTEGGRVVMNDFRAPIENLDDLPLPAWDLLDNFPESYPSSLLEAKRLPGTGIMTSRGCPFHCTFCDHRVFGSRVRFFSVEYSLNMMRHLKSEYGIRDLMVLDDNFLLDRKRLFEICDRMIAEKMDFTWYCMGHEKSMTDDRLAKIREAGCWFIEMGIESGNDGILKRIKKGTAKADVKSAVNRAKKAGLKVKGNFIFGFPGETAETLEETIRFALDIKIDFFQQNFLTVWPGCEISDELSRDLNGHFQLDGDWNKLAHQRVTFVPAGMTKDQLINASKKGFRKFYLRPRIIAGLIPRLASWRGIKFGLVSFRVFLSTILRKSPI
jgi:anaerobic magnesium-protoporphyrin IX monomethyl ester cyclase